MSHNAKDDEYMMGGDDEDDDDEKYLQMMEQEAAAAAAGRLRDHGGLMIQDMLQQHYSDVEQDMDDDSY